jgi:hypothetical protein
MDASAQSLEQVQPAATFEETRTGHVQQPLPAEEKIVAKPTEDVAPVKDSDATSMGEDVTELVKEGAQDEAKTVPKGDVENSSPNANGKEGVLEETKGEPRGDAENTSPKEKGHKGVSDEAKGEPKCDAENAPPKKSGTENVPEEAKVEPKGDVDTKQNGKENVAPSKKPFANRIFSGFRKK